MDTGSEFNPFLAASVRHFNGGLFKDARAIPLEADELRELTVAVKADWRQVEPAIFGTLLESALDPRERGSLGAHFTPRAYVERLLVPVLAEPLAADWAGVQAAAESLRAKGDAKGAAGEIRAFHRRLCALRVLDPACGTGNFLYVALEHLKRLEAEVLVALEELGEARQDALDLRGHAVGPHQFLGIEKNPRAVPIAELVIWIGYLQWHMRTRGAASLGDPILASHDTVAHADAILAWRERALVRDHAGRPVTKWDGVTWKTDPVTGRPVPDETARTEVYRYADPRPAEWPEADFIVGNPPFIGGKDLRQELGDGYAEALWAAYPHIPGGADLVMVWWDKAAARVRAGKTRRFGFITTNSITQTFSRRVVRAHLEAARAPLHLAFAIPDHPWADGTGSAAVRIAMTVGEAGQGDGVLKTVTAEGEPSPSDGAVPVSLSRTEGRINADLTIGADVAAAVPLRANERLSSPGVKLHGSGFIVTPAKARDLGLGAIDGLDRHIRPYRNGRDLTARPRGAMVIDLFGLDDDDVRRRFPAVWQHVRDTVWPEREHNNRATYRDNWWIFGEPRRELRPALHGLPRYIATVETAKHRVFQFLPAEILPDNMLVAIGLSDGFSLGVLSSRQHAAWALAAGGWLGYGNDPRYSKSRCLDPFPFPDATARQRAEISGLAEELDAHRKRVLAAHPRALTLTGLYNALEARRSGRALDDAEREIEAWARSPCSPTCTSASTPPWPRPTAGPPTSPTPRCWRAWSRSTASARGRRRAASSLGCVRSSRTPTAPARPARSRRSCPPPGAPPPAATGPRACPTRWRRCWTQCRGPTRRWAPATSPAASAASAPRSWPTASPPWPPSAAWSARWTADTGREGRGRSGRAAGPPCRRRTPPDAAIRPGRSAQRLRDVRAPVADGGAVAHLRAAAQDPRPRPTRRRRSPDAQALPQDRGEVLGREPGEVAREVRHPDPVRPCGRGPCVPGGRRRRAPPPRSPRPPARGCAPGPRRTPGLRRAARGRRPPAPARGRPGGAPARPVRLRRCPLGRPWKVVPQSCPPMQASMRRLPPATPTPSAPPAPEP